MLFKLQKRCVRMISYSPLNADSRLLFNKLRILSCYDLCLMNILVYVYKLVHTNLLNMFIKLEILIGMTHVEISTIYTK